MNDRRVTQYADLSALPLTGRVIIGLSGGVDSMTLTHYVAGRVDPGRIICAHINHMLRGPNGSGSMGEADRDEAACRDFCQALGLSIAVFREDVGAYAKEHGLGEEAAGREIRYRRFQSLVTAGDDRILTAHNADDNAETVLLNLTRGSGLSGLCGIPPQRGNILRPLLRVTRAEIEAYAREYEVPAVYDSTNDTDKYRRNRIRHKVLPVLKEINPAFLSAVSGLSDRLRRDRDFIIQQAQRLIDEARTEDGLLTQPLREAHESLRAAALKLYFEEMGSGELSSIHVGYAAEHLQNGDRLTLPGGLCAQCSCGVLSVYKRKKTGGGSAGADSSMPGEAWEFTVKLGKTALPNGKCLTLAKIPVAIYRQDCKINKLLFKSALDCDTITHDLVVRSRRPGDRFAPVGRGLTKSMKQLLLEKGIPTGLRDQVALLEMNGQVIFVEGFGIAESFQVTEKTQDVVTVKIDSARGGL